MPYPSVISTLPNPQATDRLNSPSHSSLHQSENTAIVETQTFVGTNSSAIGTLVYDIRAAASNGGGHVQTANKGGTGQTSFTKGDILIATSSSVLTKLGVSSTVGDVLTANPNAAAGVNWAAGAASTKITAQNTAISRSAGNSSALTVFFATSVLGSTLSNNNAIKYTAYFPTFSKAASNTFTANVMYGNNTVATFTVASAPSIVGQIGYLQGYIVASSVAAQMSSGQFTSETPASGSPNAIFPTHLYSVNQNSSVESSATQNLIITGQYSTADGNNSVLGGTFVVEKIQ